VSAQIAQAESKASPLWPVVLAPLVAGMYYLAVKFAFAQSLTLVLGRSDFFEEPHWGYHWIYRAAAEVISVAVGTFIAAGLAPGRERTAAIIGGCTISLGFVGKLLLTYWLWHNEESGSLVSLEPWYQHAIDLVMVISAPVIASFISDTAKQMHRDTPVGFGGINRLHFLWLWVATYCYAMGLITPVARFYAYQDEGMFTNVLLIAINGIPAAGIAIPGYYGLAFLTGEHGDTMHPAGRNLVGVIVLIFGFLVGIVIEEAWYWLTQKIFQTIFG
jgi:hypothetical protein